MERFGILEAIRRHLAAAPPTTRAESIVLYAVEEGDPRLRALRETAREVLATPTPAAWSRDALLDRPSGPTEGDQALD